MICNGGGVGKVGAESPNFRTSRCFRHFQPFPVLPPVANSNKEAKEGMGGFITVGALTGFVSMECLFHFRP